MKPDGFLDAAGAGEWVTVFDRPFSLVAYARVRRDPVGIEFGITSHVYGDDDERGYGTDIETAVPDLHAADLHCRGWVKWDGCSHLNWGEGDGGYMHVCGRGEWDALIAALTAVRAFAIENVPEMARTA